jgi:hypothetical protein
MVTTAYEAGWSGLSNGDLLDTAEKAGYQILVTTDQNLRYQQNLQGRRIAIVVLLSTSWPRIRLRIDEVVNAINTASAGGYVEVSIAGKPWIAPGRLPDR